MENIIFLVHLLTALAILGLILMQQGKGAEMGASFGSGASQTLFGASGSGNFFSKATAVLAFVFFVTSFSLAIFAKQGAGVKAEFAPELIESAGEAVPALETVPADADVPVVEDEAADAEVPEVPVE